MTTSLTRRFIAACCEVAVNRFAVQHGLTSGEISTKKAVALYGSWFSDAVERNRIFPCRVGAGKNGTRWYRVEDILLLRAEDERPAELIWK